MSMASIRTIFDRASTAPVNSPLALFKVGYDQIDCIFANTVAGQQRIATSLLLIGCVDETNSKRYVRALCANGLPPCV